MYGMKWLTNRRTHMLIGCIRPTLTILKQKQNS
nr:MAG TPA: hypothetical protein [Bacteriophage sp.]